MVTEGGRVSVVDNTLWPVGEVQPCASVRVTLSRERAVEVPGFCRAATGDTVDPTRYPRRTRRAAHGRPWFMDAMEARAADDAAWFRLHHSVIDGAGPLSLVLGPADWTHGIARPFQNVVADPNPNLTVAAVPAAAGVNGSAFAPRPGGDPRPASEWEAARCSMCAARSAASRCRWSWCRFRSPPPAVDSSRPRPPPIFTATQCAEIARHRARLG